MVVTAAELERGPAGPECQFLVPEHAERAGVRGRRERGRARGRVLLEEGDDAPGALRERPEAALARQEVHGLRAQPERLGDGAIGLELVVGVVLGRGAEPQRRNRRPTRLDLASELELAAAAQQA